MPKRKSQRRPNPRTLMAVIQALKTLPSDEPPSIFWRESFSGVPNLRFETTTEGLGWYVDMYFGNYYHVQIGTSVGEIHRSIPSLITYLHRQLSVLY